MVFFVQFGGGRMKDEWLNQVWTCGLAVFGEGILHLRLHPERWTSMLSICLHSVLLPSTSYLLSSWCLLQFPIVTICSLIHLQNNSLSLAANKLGAWVMGLYLLLLYVRVNK